jgi:Ca-activated chloride channel homolog
VLFSGGILAALLGLLAYRTLFPAPESLKEVASMTGGEYYTATSADELHKVFDSLPTLLKTRKETSEISVLFAAFAALLMTPAVLLAKLWNPLP